MIRKSIYIKTGLVIFFITFFTPFLFGDVIQHCDSLIKQGLKEQDRKNHSRALELLTEAKTIAEKNNLSKQLFLTLNNIGINYSEMLDYGEALEYFLNAYKLSIKEMNTHNEMVALVNVAIVYSKKQKYDKAEEYFLKAYESAKLNNNNLLRGTIAINLSDLANETGKLDVAESYIKVAADLLKDNPWEMAHVNTALIENEYLKGNYHTAEKIALEILPGLNEIEYKAQRISALFTLSKAYWKKGDLSLAVSYAYKVLDENPEIDIRIKVYEHLSKVFFDNKLYDKAFSYRDSVEYAKDSLSTLKNQVIFENNRIKFELQNYQKELENSQIRYENQKKVLIVIIISTILLIVLIGILLINRKTIAERNRKIGKLELEQEKSKKLLLEKQLKEQEAIALLEQERLQNEQEKLKNELESKNRELATKALYSSSKNELVEDILHSLLEFNKTIHDEKLTNLIQKLKIKQKEDIEKDNFLSHFENINNEFLSNLKEKHPNLTANEIRFLSYIYINLTTKEISSLLNITIETCKKKRKRVCQKLGLESSSILYNYLSGI